MKKVLLIDDSPFMTQMFSLRLHEEGFQTIIAGNGEEGIQMAQKEEPNIILLDIAMPAMTGWEVLKSLQENSKTKDIPVLILTNSKGNQEDIERAKGLGAKEFLMKIELKVDEIIKIVEKYI